MVTKVGGAGDLCRLRLVTTNAALSDQEARLPELRNPGGLDQFGGSLAVISILCQAGSY